MVVANDGVVDGQGPGTFDRVEHHQATAVGGRAVVGDDHVRQRQVYVALIADAATAASRAVTGRRDAVLDGEALEEHGEACRGGRIARVDVEDAVMAVTTHGNWSAAGVDDGQSAACGAGRI